jgi:ATP-binding cassette subfamily B protein/subfamily B ATP-binding cassette protein MsbA
MVKDNAALSRLLQIVPYIWQEKRALALIMLLTIISAGVAALMPWPIKLLVDYALGDAELPPAVYSAFAYFPRVSVTFASILLAGVASILLFALSTVLEMVLTWIWSVSGQRMVYALAGDMFARLQRLSLLYHYERTVGDALNRLSGDSWCAYKLASDLLVSPSQHLFTIISVSILAFQLNSYLTGLMLGAIPVLTWSALYFGKHLKRRAKQQRELQSNLEAFVQQSLVAMPIVKAFAAERRNTEAYLELSQAAVERAQQNVLVRQSYQFVNGLAMAVGTAMVLYVGGSLVLAGTLTVGSLLVFVAYVNTLKMAFGGLLDSYGNFKEIEASVDRVVEILESRHEVRNFPGALPFTQGNGNKGVSIQLEKVTFGYLDDEPVLEDIALDVELGESVALVGATGAGKTTLVSLIPRFFDVWQGNVRINGIDVRDIQINSLREQIALVLQEPFLLPISIAENIAYARPDANEEEIVSAARTANADEFIRKLPDGYDTVVGERGATLSVGQRQRISIARAVLKNAPILIFDEPTSALDVETEALVLEAVARLLTDRTTLIIAHRLSTIRNADRIVVMESGKVVEIGTHESLMSADGIYRRFYQLQSAEAAK